MLYETLQQPKLLLIFFIIGIICAFVFDIGNFLKFLFSNKKISHIIIDFIQTSLVLVIMFLTNLKFNYGLIRLFPVIIFILSFSVYRFTIGKFVAKIYSICYNIFEKVKNHRNFK